MEDSKNGKRLLQRVYNHIFSKYENLLQEDISEYLYDCIDIYIENENLYYGTIHGFFRYIPCSTLGERWHFWRKYSDLWEKKYYYTKYIK